MIRLRPATLADAPVLKAWDEDPAVIAATTDDPDATAAFDGIVWEDELAAQSDVSRHYIAELDGRPIGGMQIIDPHLEPTHYWGDCAPNLRAIDIWIGPPEFLGQGWGTRMMRAAIARCFATPSVTAILIDPLEDNLRARRFYERLGFRPLGPRRFGDDDCIVYRLDRP